jgi:hypothetical protein
MRDRRFRKGEVYYRSPTYIKMWYTYMNLFIYIYVYIYICWDSVVHNINNNEDDNDDDDNNNHNDYDKGNDIFKNTISAELQS